MRSTVFAIRAHDLELACGRLVRAFGLDDRSGLTPEQQRALASAEVVLERIRKERATVTTGCSEHGLACPEGELLKGK